MCRVFASELMKRTWNNSSIELILGAKTQGFIWNIKYLKNFKNQGFSKKNPALGYSIKSLIQYLELTNCSTN
jgi:hypothetical protein